MSIKPSFITRGLREVFPGKGERQTTRFTGRLHLEKAFNGVRASLTSVMLMAAVPGAPAQAIDISSHNSAWGHTRGVAVQRAEDRLKQALVDGPYGYDRYALLEVGNERHIVMANHEKELISFKAEDLGL